jgi:hypothetical protein
MEVCNSKFEILIYTKPFKRALKVKHNPDVSNMKHYTLKQT